MKKIIALLALLSTPSIAQEPKETTKVIDVAIPMLCGEYKDLRKVLEEGKYTDIAIGKDQITKGTYITISYSSENKMSVIGQWAEDMSYGCLAYVMGDAKFVKDVDNILKPKPNL